ncbi:tyrosine-type recombinase/integrase [Planctomycetota bacterium]
MTRGKQTYSIDVMRMQSTLKTYMETFGDMLPSQQQRRATRINRFTSFAYDHCEYCEGHLLLTETQLMKWMKQVARDYCLESAMRTFATVDKFLQSLANESVLSANPMGTFLARYDRQGWKGIAKALKSTKYWPLLTSLKSRPRFTGIFGKHAMAYINMHRAAGAKYTSNECILVEFNRFLHKQGIESSRKITPSVIVEWARAQTCQPISRRHKLLRLAHFFRYLRSLRIVSRNPVTQAVIDSFGPPGQTFKPYIYSREEVTLLLECSKHLQSDIWYRLKPETFSTLISILYTLGLRVTEALRLRIGDINIDNKTIFVRKGKFYKERILPYGPKLGRCLERYLDVRKKIVPSVTDKDPLFIGRHNEFMSAAKIDKFFPRLLKACGIVTPSDQHRPRLHDLRHSFAVHRLLRWYREDVDVQSKLVLLATFMGHVEIFSTQIYLSITDSLLKEANKRFYNTFGSLVNEEVES